MDKLRVVNMDSNDTDNIYNLYCQLKEIGRLDVFMYEDNSLQAFINFMHKGWIYKCVFNGMDVGITVFNQFKGKSAFFHFVIFNGGEPYAVRFARIIFNSVFINESLLTIQGFTPKCYRHVFPLMREIGMESYFDLKESCMVKGKLRTGVYSAITREHFYKQKESKCQQLL